MWTCSNCGERIEDNFDSCWKCSTFRPGATKPPLRAPPVEANKPSVQYRIFRSGFDSWDSLFTMAAAFATEIGPRRLIGISHSEDSNDGVVTVWFWSEDLAGGQD